MANTLTTNYSWTKPEVGADPGAWGGHLNGDLDSIDSTVFAVSGVANAALPKAGGTMTGDLAAKTVSYSTVAKGTINGAQSLDLSAADAFIATCNGAITWTFANPVASRFASFILLLTNGGSAVQTWPASVKWPGGTAPSLTAAGVDAIAFVTFDGGTTWYGNAIRALA